jgi:hypothetical protein
MRAQPNRALCRTYATRSELPACFDFDGNMDAVRQKWTHVGAIFPLNYFVPFVTEFIKRCPKTYALMTRL